MIYLFFFPSLISHVALRLSCSSPSLEQKPGADLGGGCRGCAPPPDDLRFSNTTGILQKQKTMWFIGVEVEQETSAPPPKKIPGSAPENTPDICSHRRSFDNKC